MEKEQAGVSSFQISWKSQPDISGIIPEKISSSHSLNVFKTMGYSSKIRTQSSRENQILIDFFIFLLLFLHFLFSSLILPVVLFGDFTILSFLPITHRIERCTRDHLNKSGKIKKQIQNSVELLLFVSE
jgi:hypothetical protein